tara:strand:+ start:5400 stop:7268 length:1869 start_codon:yes stop_codon:yes gene_type:complete
MNVDLKSRKKRMSLLFDDIKLIHTDDLIKVCKITEKSLDNLKDAVMFYIWDCLISSNPNTKIKISENFFDINQNIIKNLPNITPNGLVVPKKENLMSFNKLQKVIFDEFSKNNINENIDRVQFPINVRLQSGSFKTEERPRASTKKHTDIWAGDPSGAIIVFLHLYGDYEKIGIDFFKTEQFPKSLVKTLDDYDYGNNKIDGIKELHLKYDDSGWIFVDPFILHQTFKKSDGIRISLDFRFIPKDKVDSDTFEDENRKPYFISVKEWKNFGDSKILATEQGLFGEIKKNSFTSSYPVDIFYKEILENENKNILTADKFIGEKYIKEKFNLSNQQYFEIFRNKENLLEYKVLTSQERDDVIKSILEKINLKDLRISGENNNDVWEKGWGEILDSIRHGFSPEKIMPQYFDHHKIMRLDGKFITEISDNFVYKYDQIIRKVVLKKYASSKSKLVELGCGTGSGTLLAALDLDENINITASDWAISSLPILKEISKFTCRDINAVQFNMLDLNGWDSLSIDEDTTVISFHALEQLGNNYKKLLSRLCKNKPLCVHLEPIYEYYNNENLFDTLAKNYHKKRNYLGKYLTDIKLLEKEGKAEILEEIRIGFGDRYHEAYSLLVWKGK